MKAIKVVEAVEDTEAVEVEIGALIITDVWAVIEAEFIAVEAVEAIEAIKTGVEAGVEAFLNL